MIYFCSMCGHSTQRIIPAGDTHQRDVCTQTQCAFIHYENPKIIVGTLPIWKNKVLLCKRAIEPRKGYWTLAAGFMEMGETCEQGAHRETLEEAGAQVKLRQLLAVLSLPHTSQVHLFYSADLIDGVFEAGLESLEVALFSYEDIPWTELAFATVTRTLEHYFSHADTPNMTQLVATIAPMNTD